MGWRPAHREFATQASFPFLAETRSMIDRKRFFPFFGRMRWQMISYLACSLAGLTCPLLQGQKLPSGTVKYDLWQKDKTISSGLYKVIKPVSLDGRTDGAGKNARLTMRVYNGAAV